MGKTTFTQRQWLFTKSTASLRKRTVFNAMNTTCPIHIVSPAHLLFGFGRMLFATPRWRFIADTLLGFAHFLFGFFIKLRSSAKFAKFFFEPLGAFMMTEITIMVLCIMIVLSCPNEIFSTIICFIFVYVMYMKPCFITGNPTYSNHTMKKTSSSNGYISSYVCFRFIWNSFTKYITIFRYIIQMIIRFIFDAIHKNTIHNFILSNLVMSKSISNRQKVKAKMPKKKG